MDMEYDRKFEEMKKYIPFLESMIKRLESTSSASNPRQAQLDKIRSLRDLLMDKKKRMKMENLLKCEQVLVNLYEKVEQRDSLQGLNKKVSPTENNSELNIVRKKLISSVTKIHKESVETLPEIARASVTEEVCVPGSKEPALFQRRPNKSSISPIRAPQNKKTETSPQLSKRNYTRILLSPERSQNSWFVDEMPSEKPLFCRRSPRKSPRGRSPPHHKKERKKNVKNKSEPNLSKDLNITLKVPKESLNSLNTKDILSRIINCSDKDVDIETLRELRSQILGELKETGTNEDISDLILKSYKKKSKKVVKSKEVEEGELSDSESEAIESIYGSLVIMDSEKVSTSASNNKSDDENLRKIQICLVINSEQTIENNEEKIIAPVDFSESVSENKQNNTESKVSENTNVEGSSSILTEEHNKTITRTDQVELKIKDESDKNENNKNLSADFKEKEDVSHTNVLKNDEKNDLQKENEDVDIIKDTHKPNFYKQVNDKDLVSNKQESEDISKINIRKSDDELHDKGTDVATKIPTEKSDNQIPLIEPTKKVSEIDILQALKKEILCETDNVLSPDIETPLLHQPKLTKVVNANEVGSKKRISIEKYKAKTSSITTVDKEASNKKNKEKQSLKLTEKECERFNFPSKLSLGESSEDEDEKNSTFYLDTIYENLAPKSPDHEDFADTGIKPPVIIPSDRVQTAVVSSQADVDMRKILPVSSSKETGFVSAIDIKPKSLSMNLDIKSNEKPKSPLHDPRMKRDNNVISKSESPNPYSMSIDKTLRPTMNYNNMNSAIIPNATSPLGLNVNNINRNVMISSSLPPTIPNLVPNMLPNLTSNILPNMTPNLLPNMTPNRTPNLVPNMTPRFDMTPSRQISDVDDYGNRKHVYAPMFSVDNRDNSDKLRENKHQPWDSADKNKVAFWDDVDVKDNDNRPSFEQYQSGPRNERFNFDQMVDCPPTPNPSFGRLDCPPTPNPSFGRLDCPPTPNPSFGRLDCPPTPNPSFGRLDCTATPNPSFGRLDCPATPTPSFGRIDTPNTPIHHFGRSECPPTPSHPFGRPEPLLPSPFTRSDYNQASQNQSFGKGVGSRSNRTYDNYDNYHNRDDDRDRGIYQENKFNSNSYQNNRNNNPDYYRRYQREQSVGSTENNRSYEKCKHYDNSGRNYRDLRHETSVGRYSRDYENDRYARNQKLSRNYDYRRHNDSKNYDDRDRRYRRDKSVDRTSSRSLSRDSTSTKVCKENTLSVQRHTGQFLTIDTNIKSSFQYMNTEPNKISFNDRKQRAASVGRSLGRESSPRKKREFESERFSINFENKNNRPDYRRACSVGRDTKAIESNLDFKDIKADLKSFKLKEDLKWSKEITKEDKKSSQTSNDAVKSSGPRSRREIYDSHEKFTASKYSPKKNIRDPRMRREHNQNICKDRNKSKDSKGIVYSNDNITKGTILGPGYGVKNYKIPKLKRIEEPVENKDEDNKTINSSKKDNTKITTDNKTNLDKKCTNKKNINMSQNKFSDSYEASKEINLVKNTNDKLRGSKKRLDSFDDMKSENNSQDTEIIGKDSPNPSIDNKQEENDAPSSLKNNIERRITRSASKSFSNDSSMELSPVKRSKRIKKPLVYESDSDDNEQKIEKSTVDSSPDNQNINNKMLNKVVISKTDNELTKSPLKSTEYKPTTDLENNFGIDDLEIFSDNIISDPVIDNINDLIADLDQDLDPSKTVGNDDFTEELSLEKMMENITSPESDETSQETPLKLLAQADLEIKIADEHKKLKQRDKIIAECKKNTNDTPVDLENLSNSAGKDDNVTVETTPSDNIEISENQPLASKSSESVVGVENHKHHEKLCSNDTCLTSEPISQSKNQDNLDKLSPDMLRNDDAIVSTSEDGAKVPSAVKEPENHIDVASTPDSTINSNIIDTADSERNLPDSTNDLSTEKKTIINSCHNNSFVEDGAEPSTHHPQASNEIENIGKLLSILQDKSKIKELLHLLGDQSSENEKIKKKLEKLSQIVSEDEEALDSNVENVGQNSTEIKSNDNVSEDLVTEDNVEKNKSSKLSNKILEESNNDSNENSSNVKVGETSIKEANIAVETMKEIQISNKVENIIINKDNNNEDQEEGKETNLITKKINNKSLPKKDKRKKLGKLPIEQRRLTRSDAANMRLDKTVVKKPSRELKKLQEDIKEFIRDDDILNTTGIRMCRLAKFVDETKSQKDDTFINENKQQEPMVILKKNIGVTDNSNTSAKEKNVKKKIKGKNNVLGSIYLGKGPANEGKTKDSVLIDPYEFETDSLNETIKCNDNNIHSESESDSLESTISFGSTEVLGEIKKKKRKRGKGWQAGVIKPKNKKKRVDSRKDSDVLIDTSNNINKNIEKLDPNCFTDKTYCFDKNKSTYDCRLCHYTGGGAVIVCHYKKQHPHFEIPLSRMNPVIAVEAIAESEKINCQLINKISSKKYVCRFCFKEFGRKKPVLESFFWHVVSMHTGEYKQLCSECQNETHCPFSLDIPPPPKDKGQLLGYVCEKCNYTQISIQNLKSHIILRHNNEQTTVYTINLSVMAKSIVNSHLLSDSEEAHNLGIKPVPRVLRNSLSNQSFEDYSDAKSDSTGEYDENSKIQNYISKNVEDEKVFKTSTIQSKITFENDNTDELLNFSEPSKIKLESELNDNPEQFNQEDLNQVINQIDSNQDDFNQDNLNQELDVNSQFDLEQQNEESMISQPVNPTELNVSNDIINYPHFKIKLSESGSKEYICCINGEDLHYRTTLLISFKKHVQLKHSENWDGFCFICKVIVMPQGKHLFKECLQHFLDQHLDDFPILEETPNEASVSYRHMSNTPNREISESPKPYINVRPLSQLISQSVSQLPEENSTLPIIKSVVSLGAEVEEPQPISFSSGTTQLKENKYEQAQTYIMSQKHRVVLGAMMTQTKLVQVFKCAGRFCSFTTNVAEDALIHASTHTEIGGENSLKCVYCDFDTSGNAIDLVTHVFKDHGCCQYSCGLCFYRAAASQLVNAHIVRVHGPSSVNDNILHTAFQTSTIKEDNMLTREVAVPYYLCCATSGPNETCRFRTYTPGKFCEHLQLRHPTLTEHSCFICQTSLKTPADLIRHLKSHGLKLYQCTWCVFGADSEPDLLAHQSVEHPDRLPKAYLRIITNKEGTSEFRVLPLAHLNKSEVSVIEVGTSNIKYDPIKDAERSIELEKLIGKTTLMVESLISESNAAEKQPTISEIRQNINEPSLEDRNLENALEQSRKQLITPPPSSQNIQQIESQLIPIIKTEATQTPEKAPNIPSEVVLCLDSDEEDSSQNIIDLSEEKSTEPKLLPLNELFVCAKCNMILKCGTRFRKHISACCQGDFIQCAHCPLQLRKRLVVSHYTKCHYKICDIFACTQCQRKFGTLSALKEHERMSHSGSSDLKSNQTNKPGPRKGRKRSLIAKEKLIGPPEKIKKYGPSDVNLLPINPILDESVFCSLCEFSTKVRLNMVRHLQLHAEQQPVPQTAPVNPVPHLETNEKHFDRMVNLASSSLVPKVSDKSKSDNNASIPLQIPPEAASRYPKFVPEKHRHTCGAKGCSYISVDESMLKCHWETLHSGANDFRCVHCPPHQQLDTSRPLTAGRIIAHLKMHDATLYACSLCSYYHYKRHILDNHLSAIHQGGRVMVVREEGNIPSSPVASTSQAQTAAPTMDLKPWQCGLCKFKRLLRPEVVEHCAKVHNSKMQYKCAYCAFRTSNSENITKHQSNSHTDKQEEIFYYYYREGSVPDDADGTPLWQKQSQKYDVSMPKIKHENPGEILPTQIILPVVTPTSIVTSDVDLNLVKKEVFEPVDDSIENLCKDFGNFCEPNGLKYKCSLCKNVVEDSIEAMQSHLFEELKYRKWGCSICSYKAFHKAGLSVHMQTEHRQNKEPIALALNNRVETWVAKLLEHQTELIKKNKENLVKQKEEILRSTPGTSRQKSPPRTVTASGSSQSDSSENSSSKLTMVELERLFGSLGASVSLSFCCPKCNSIIKDEDVMQQHLESELNKIRWLCSNCFITFQNYHEAQFHCRSVHIGQSARPTEATRDPSVRTAWVRAVIHVQKLSMNYVPLTPNTFGKDIEKPVSECSNPENSLLVVRYEERVPTPEEQMARRTPVLSATNDEDIIAEERATSKQNFNVLTCLYCEYKSINAQVFRGHLLRHYNLKPTTCTYCGLSGGKRSLVLHHKSTHPNEPLSLKPTDVPNGSPLDYLQKNNPSVDITNQICLVCRNAFTETEAATHVHDNVPTVFGEKGDVVVKCSICLSLFKNVNSYFNHHKSSHAPVPVDYVFNKLSINTQLDFDEENETGSKRPIVDSPLSSPSKKVARKSTTKLPFNKPCARKSTTKLPLNVLEERSHYGSKPTTRGLENVSGVGMLFTSTPVQLPFDKLQEAMKIKPIVLVKKLEQ